jgi:sortase A
VHWRPILSFIGRTCITLGLLILLFVGYQLWGTGIYEARQQRSLKAQFERAQTRRSGVTSTTGGAGSTTSTGPTASTLPDAAPPPPAGDAVAIIRIPRIGLERAVVEGVSLADLRKGPGHYPRTVMPGEIGNAAIAGHRTTYGAPFNRIDELKPGDPIDITTLRGTYRYRMARQTVVNPNDVGVLQPTSEAQLTLTSCHPKYSAAHRIVVVATLDTTSGPPPVAAPPPSTTETTSPAGKNPPRLQEAGLSGVRASRTQTIHWGIITALVGLAWWFVFHRRRRVWVWFAGAAPFLFVLFFFYANLERILPGNF